MGYKNTRKHNEYCNVYILRLPHIVQHHNSGKRNKHIKVRVL